MSEVQEGHPVAEVISLASASKSDRHRLMSPHLLDLRKLCIILEEEVAPYYTLEESGLGRIVAKQMEGVEEEYVWAIINTLQEYVDGIQKVRLEARYLSETHITFITVDGERAYEYTIELGPESFGS